MRLEIVLCHTPAIVVHDTEIVLGKGVTGRDQPGYHDWENILSDLRWMQYDHTIAGIVDTMGEGLMLISFLWGARVLYLQYKNLDRQI